jgi:SHS2 domain-containing protein
LEEGGGVLSDRIVEHGIEGKFDFLEHPADVYIVAYGGDLLELYSNAGLALFETMTDTRRIEGRVKKSIRVEGFDLESLLYRWIEELLTLYYSDNIVCGRVIASRFIMEDHGEPTCILEGECLGEEFDPGRHEARVEVKAVTYHLMRIIRDEKGRWRVYFVLDI